MKKGVIMFIYREDVIESKAYHTVWERKMIIRKWGEKYKRQWGEECVIQIFPTYDVHAVLQDGTNQKNINDKPIRFNNEQRA